MNLNNHIQQILTRHGNTRLAILFGSLAGARATPQNDLDPTVQMDAPLTAETPISLIGDLSQATNRPVDLIDLRVAGEPPLGQTLKHKGTSINAGFVIPANAGIQSNQAPGFRVKPGMTIYRSAHNVRLPGSDSNHAELLKRHLFDEAGFMPYRRRTLAERRQACMDREMIGQRYNNRNSGHNGINRDYPADKAASFRRRPKSSGLKISRTSGTTSPSVRFAARFFILDSGLRRNNRPINNRAINPTDNTILPAPAPSAQA
jgi:predicted nucleotidyltransferase